MLHVGYNPLDGALLPLAGLTGLTDLNLSGLKLREIPLFLSVMKALRVLDLNNNSIVSLPPFLANCAALQVLHLSGNRLAALTASPLAALKKLKVFLLFFCSFSDSFLMRP